MVLCLSLGRVIKNEVMKLTKDQALGITQKVTGEKTCVNCGYNGTTDQPVRVVEMETSLLTTESNEDVKSLPFIIFSCPKCGYTTFINLDSLGIL